MNAAVAAIQYALDQCDGTGDSMDFLRYWNEGEFDILRRNWEDIPDAVFIGADPLHPGTKAALEREIAESQGESTQVKEEDNRE